MAPGPRARASDGVVPRTRAARSSPVAHPPAPRPQPGEVVADEYVRAVEDESEGYHRSHTVWSWSAGIGTTADGRSVGWNLVSGINDPPERSERAVWIDGEPTEPGPVEFEGLDAITFDDGA